MLVCWLAGRVPHTGHVELSQRNPTAVQSPAGKTQQGERRPTHLAPRITPADVAGEKTRLQNELLLPKACKNQHLGHPGKLGTSLLWPLEQKLNQHFFCLRPPGTDMFLVGFKYKSVPPHWPGRSHRPGRTGQSSDFASWMKEKGLVPTGSDCWWAPCHVSVGLQGEPRRCCPRRKTTSTLQRATSELPRDISVCLGLAKLPARAGDVPESSAQISVLPLSWIPALHGPRGRQV